MSRLIIIVLSLIKSYFEREMIIKIKSSVVLEKYQCHYLMYLMSKTIHHYECCKTMRTYICYRLSIFFFLKTLNIEKDIGYIRTFL